MNRSKDTNVTESSPDAGSNVFMGRVLHISYIRKLVDVTSDAAKRLKERGGVAEQVLNIGEQCLRSMESVVATLTGPLTAVVKMGSDALEMLGRTLGSITQAPYQVYNNALKNFFNFKGGLRNSFEGPRQQLAQEAEVVLTNSEIFVDKWLPELPISLVSDSPNLLNRALYLGATLPTRLYLGLMDRIASRKASKKVSFKPVKYVRYIFYDTKEHFPHVG